MLNPQVWAESFATRLGIRPRTQHSTCNECKLYGDHLKRQYADRVEYWKSRALSRSGIMLPSGMHSMTMICDGVDRAKFKYPRSEALTAKEFPGIQDRRWIAMA